LLIGARQALRWRSATARARCIWARTRWRSRPSPTRRLSRRGDWVAVTRAGAEFHDPRTESSSAASCAVPRAGCSRKRQLSPLHGKEIHEQPESSAYARPLRRHGAQRLRPFACPSIPTDFAGFDRRLRRLYGGLVGKYWIERFARLPVEIDVASEYRYREARSKRRPDDLHFAIRRNRRHARFDALRQEQGAKTIGVVNVPTSSIARLADAPADLGRPGDRRRLDQGLHLQLATMACWRSGSRASAARSAKRRKPRWWRTRRHARLLAQALKLEPAVEQIATSSRAPATFSISARTPIPSARGRSSSRSSAISTPRLCGGRIEARADRADRRGHAGDRPRAEGRGSKRPSQHAGSRRARRRIILIGERHAADEAALDLESFLAMPTWALPSRRSSTRAGADARLSTAVIMAKTPTSRAISPSR